MKKPVLLITVALTLGLSMTACNKSGKLNTTSKTPAPSGPVEFKLKWPVGEHIVQSLDFKQKSETTVPNQPTPVKQEMAMGQSYGLSVLKEDADGGHEVEMEILRMRMKMNQGSRTLFDYDSDKKSPGDNANPVAEVLQKIVGAKLQFFLDASNSVQRVEGINELRNRLTTSGNPRDPSGAIKGIFSEDYFKQMMDFGQNLPSKPVQPGDSWSATRDISMGEIGALTLNYDITFKNWEQRGKRTCARLEYQGTVKSRPAPNPASNGMTMTIQSGNTSGVSWFDPELGMVIDSNFNQDMKMTITVAMPTRGKTVTQTMTSDVSQEINMKLDSVK